MKVKVIGVIAVIALVAAACSGGTSDDGDLEGVDSGPSVTSASDSAGGGEKREATVVTIGSETYEVDGPTVCLTGAALSFTIANGTEQISINHSNDVVLIRMTIDGEKWDNAGSPPSPVVTGDGGDAVITWSGEMASNGGFASVSIEAYC